MHDTVELEKLGIPTALVITDAFMNEAEVLRAGLGMEALAPVTIGHPLSTLSDKEIEAKARAVVEPIKHRLLGSVQEN